MTPATWAAPAAWTVAEAGTRKLTGRPTAAATCGRAATLDRAWWTIVGLWPPWLPGARPEQPAQAALQIVRGVGRVAHRVLQRIGSPRRAGRPLDRRSSQQPRDFPCRRARDLNHRVDHVLGVLPR